MMMTMMMMMMMLMMLVLMMATPTVILAFIQVVMSREVRGTTRQVPASET